MTDDVPDPFAPAPAPIPGPIVPERARIEPPPPPKRRDALPVLYLVGFVILAASLIYLWKHPSLPRSAALEVVRIETLRQQVNGLQAKLDQLAAHPAVATPDIEKLQAQVAELISRPIAQPAAPTDLAPLNARITALETRPLPGPPIDLGPIDNRIRALEAKPPVDLAPVQQRIEALSQKEAEDAAALSKKQAEDAATLDKKAAEQATALDSKTGAALAAMTKRLDSVEAQAKQTSDRLAAVAQKAALAGKLQAAAGALEAGQPLGDIPGAPPALARFAQKAPPTEAGLRVGFESAAQAAHDASQPQMTDNQPLLSRMWTRAQQSVTVRQGEHVLVGDPIAGTIAAARQSLDAGDLAGAVKTLDGLNAPAKAAMADWIAQAQSLIDARAAIGTLAARG